MRSFPAGTPVRLTWEDAMHDTQTQFNSIAEALNDYAPCFRKTLGHYIGEADKNGRRCIVIAMDDDRAKDSEEKFGGPFYCPIGMVIKIEPLDFIARTKRK